MCVIFNCVMCFTNWFIIFALFESLLYEIHDLWIVIFVWNVVADFCTFGPIAVEDEALFTVIITMLVGDGWH